MGEKRILLCAYYAKNLGDDLFLKILFERYPSIKWELLTANKHYKEIFREYKNVKIIPSYRELIFGKLIINPFFLVNDFLLKYHKYDGVIFIGGSIFMQSPAWVKRFKERSYLLSTFKSKNRKAFIVGSNFGPYKEQIFLKKYKELFKEVDDVCFRDTHSYNLFKKIENVRMAPDIVFSLKKIYSDYKEKKVGFSVINLEKRDGLSLYSEAYKNKMIELIEKYIDLGYRVNMYSFCNNEGDLETIKLIKKGISGRYQKNIEVVEYKGNIEEFLTCFSTCEIVIGNRFHSIILALLFNQSVFPIIYSDKTYNVLSDLKMENKSCRISEIEKLDVSEVISQAANNKLKNRRVLKDADLQFEKLDDYLELRMR